MPATLQPPRNLSTHDTNVLAALFDSESPLAPSEVTQTSKDSSYPPQPPGINHLQARETVILHPLNTPNPSKAAIQTAILALTELIDTAPTHASAYANRAQATRLLLPEQAFTAGDTNLLSSILSDLSRAIAIASSRSPISAGHARVLATAHTHRGLILYRLSHSEALKCLPASLKGLGAEQLEEMASRDFAEGGRYGDKVARQMAVRTNPYAKMCGAIVKEAMEKEIAEYRGMNSLERGNE